MDEIYATIECLAQVIAKLRAEKAVLQAELQKAKAELDLVKKMSAS